MDSTAYHRRLSDGAITLAGAKQIPSTHFPVQYETLAIQNGGHEFLVSKVSTHMLLTSRKTAELPRGIWFVHLLLAAVVCQRFLAIVEVLEREAKNDQTTI